MPLVGDKELGKIKQELQMARESGIWPPEWPQKAVEIIRDFCDTREALIAKIEKRIEDATAYIQEYDYTADWSKGYRKACQIILNFIRNPKEV